MSSTSDFISLAYQLGKGFPLYPVRCLDRHPAMEPAAPPARVSPRWPGGDERREMPTFP
jgi:hypothetical protein